MNEPECHDRGAMRLRQLEGAWRATPLGTALEPRFVRPGALTGS